jgi:hypothetical protein
LVAKELLPPSSVRLTGGVKPGTHGYSGEGMAGPGYTRGPGITVGRRAVGALNDTLVEFKVEFKEPEPKPFPSVPVGAGTFNLERSTLVSRTRPRRR